MFSVFLDNQSVIWKNILNLKFPDGAKILDFTFGSGALWWDILDDEYLKKKYIVTACDAEPNDSTIIKRNIFTDDYTDLGTHDAALFDPPYLINRNSFDYPSKLNPVSHRQGMFGKRSWGSDKLKKFVANQSVETFNDRVKSLCVKAPTVLKHDGLLIVKVMDPRHDGSIVPHHVNIINILSTTFKLDDVGIYIRQGATTWKVKGHFQNLHGYWLVFRLNASRENVVTLDDTML